MEPQLATQSQAEPTGVSLKAAYLLLREMNQSPEPPTLESLAVMLDTVLNYEWAVRLIRVTAETVRDIGDAECMKEGLEQFETWANENLLR